MSTDSPVDFVLITALPEERDALLSTLPEYQKLPPINDDIRTYYQANMPINFSDNTSGQYRVIVMCLLGMGRLQAATATTDAIRRWRPRYLILIGIAGGVAARKVQIGDILISDQIVDYELQKLTSEGSEIRWEVQRADMRLLNACNNYTIENWHESVQIRRPKKGIPDRHLGPIASGDKIIAFREVLDKFQDVWPKLIGVEMEAAGVATAAFQSPDKPGFFMIRGVSDLADSNKGSTNVEKWRSYACAVAAAFAVEFIKSGPVPPAEVEDRRRVEIILEGEFDEFILNRKHVFIGTLAALLEVDASNIRVLNVYQGSIVVVIEMPVRATNRLHELAVSTDNRIINLGVKSIFVEGQEIIKLSKHTEEILDSSPGRLSFTVDRETPEIFIRKAIRKDLPAWFKVSGDEFESLGFLQLVKRKSSEYSYEGQPRSVWLATKSILDDAIDELERREKIWANQPELKNSSLAELIRKTYIDQVNTRILAQTYSLAPDRISRLQQKAMDMITEIILRWELELKAELVAEIEKTLPPKTYRRLFGIQKAKAIVIEQILNPTSPQVIVITGIGGIGKTAFAQEMCREIARYFYFEKIIWLRIYRNLTPEKQESPDIVFDKLVASLAEKLLPEQERLYQLGTHIKDQLNSAPHLIVIDDLKTQDETNSIITAISRLESKGKFILTSRVQPESSEVFSFALTELSFDETKQLIHHLVNDPEHSGHIQLNERDLETIYETIGGNPLAILMIVRLARDLPLSIILDDISFAGIKKKGEIFAYIYRQAWEGMSNDARKLIKLMPLISRSGATFGQLQVISELETNSLAKAIRELWQSSLLEILQDEDSNKRYAIHRITENFIRSEIIYWPKVE